MLTVDPLPVTTSPDLTSIITAVGSVITACALVISALALLVPILRTAKRTEHMVNQTHTDLLNYQALLIRTLDQAGLDVPEDPAHAPPGD